MERIDLAQFKLMTDGDWKERDMVRWIVRGDFLDNDANVAVICAAPELLAELTRMYKREDFLLGCIKGIVNDANDYVIYDKEDEMWVYDEEKSSNPGLDAMDFVIDLATTDVDAWIKENSI